jgi:predicted negative regulator of RcsB-dependent stress response
MFVNPPEHKNGPWIIILLVIATVTFIAWQFWHMN